MSVAYDPKSGIALPDQGTNPWTAALLANWTALATMCARSNVWYVDKGYTIANLFSHAGVRPASCRFFDTVQGAIDAAQSAGGYNANTSIIVSPDTYNETITITGSVHLYSLHAGAQFAMLGSAGLPLIRGTGGQNQVITIDIPDSATASVGFHGINFDNSYAGDTSGTGTINKAYLLDATRQATFNSSPVWVGFDRCGIRMQTWGNRNEWVYGLKFDGHYYVNMLDCEISAMSYAGGSNIGGICYPVYLYGPGLNTPNQKTAIMRMKRTDITRSETGSLSAASRMFYLDQYTSGQANGCTFSDPDGGQPLYFLGSNGTNVFPSIAAAGAGGVPNTYGNVFNVNSVML